MVDQLPVCDHVYVFLAVTMCVGSYEWKCLLDQIILLQIKDTKQPMEVLGTFLLEDSTFVIQRNILITCGINSGNNYLNIACMVKLMAG